MSNFTSKDRQRIIDGYLSATGRNLFIPAEFVDWLAKNKDHEAYPWFFSMTDKQAAREHRITLARRMASGLRIVVQDAAPSTPQVVHITTREFPAFVSPVAGRKDGGGYSPFDPSDVEMMNELRSQGAQSLITWLTRYRGAAAACGVDVKPIEQIAEALRPKDVAA